MSIQNLFLFIATNVRTMSVVGGLITQTGTMSAAGNATSRFTHKVAQGTYPRLLVQGRGGGGTALERTDLRERRVGGKGFWSAAEARKQSRNGSAEAVMFSHVLALQTSCNVQSLLWILSFVNATPGLRTQVLPLTRPGFFQLSQGGPPARVRHL